MAVLRGSPLLSQLLPAASRTKRRGAAAPPAAGAHGGPKKTHLLARGRRRRGSGGGEGARCLPTTEGEAGVASGGAEEAEEEGEYLVRECGWGVRRVGRVGEEMRRVALVQAEAFHVPVAIFNDFFFDFFKAEVLSALIYRVRNSPPDRPKLLFANKNITSMFKFICFSVYACLVAEDVEATMQLSLAPFEKIVGVVDCTVQDEQDILKNLQGADEYFYVSGIAVLPSFRRRKVGTALLKACEALALQWRHRFMALRAYEDDYGARGLYSKAGYRVVSRDPDWVTWIGRRRRVLMIKELPVHDHQIEQQ
ncbi:hypothetical protein ACP4OV_007016 [Aristida adscensionis]